MTWRDLLVLIVYRPLSEKLHLAGELMALPTTEKIKH